MSQNRTADEHDRSSMGWLELHPHPVVGLDATGSVVAANAAALGLAGAAASDLQRCARILPEAVEELVAECLKTGAALDDVAVDVGRRVLAWSFRPGPGPEMMAAFAFDITDWKESEAALRRKDDLLEAVGYAARVILESPVDGIPFDEVLARLGEATGVSRVYAFRNHTSGDGHLLASQVAEWTQSHVEPQIDNPELQDVPYEEAGMARWARELEKGVTLAGTVDEFPPEEQDLLRAQEILSLVVTPILVGRSLWGFIGFDDCDVARTWTRAELEVLRAAADTVAAGLHRLEAIDELEESRHQLRHVQRMEAVGRLAGGIAHDFNNLLTGILANAEILLTDLAPSDPARTDVDEIRRAAVKAAGLTRQLLAFSRRQTIRPSSMDLGRLVDDMEGLLRRVIGESIDVETRLQPDAPAVWADRVQVEQVLMNLAVNARDAMPDGGRLVVGVEEGALEAGPLVAGDPDPSAGYVLLSVSDTGTGMDETTREKALEPFFTTKESGTGMGLSIVYGIVTQMDGALRIESRPGEGTEVVVAFPVSGMPATEEPVATPATGSDAGGAERILVVEDDDAVRAVTARILERAGYTVVPAATAGQGAEAVHEQGDAIDLLLTDIGLPDRSGTELAEDVRNARPDLPILFMSGFPGERSPEIPLAEEPVDFLPKPFRQDDLLRRVRQALDEVDGSHR